jgi:hypothetical protein
MMALPTSLLLHTFSALATFAMLLLLDKSTDIITYLWL